MEPGHNFESVTDEITAAEKAQIAVDLFCEEKNIDIDDIEAILEEHI